jgi:hypothetical protein
MCRSGCAWTIPETNPHFFSVTRDSAEVVMETRAATASLVLFGFDGVIVGLSLLLGTRWAKRSD